MAEEKKKIREVEKELKQLENRLNNLAKQDLNRTIQGLKDGGARLEEWNRQLDRFKVEADEVANSLDYIAKSFKDAVNELQKQNKALADGKRTLNSLANDAQRVLAIRVGETDLNRKNLEQKVKELGTQRRILKLARDAAGAETAKGKELQSAIDNLGRYESATKEVLKTDKQIENSIGATASIFKGLEKTLGKFGLPAIGIEDAFKETKRLVQEAAHTEKKGFKPMATFAGLLTKNIKESLSLTKLLELAALAVGKAFMFIDTSSGNLAKQLGISNKEARGLVKEFRQISDDTRNIFINSSNLTEAFGQLSKELGLAKFASDSILESQVRLTKQAGYSVEAATELTKLGAVQGTDAEGLLSNFLGQAEALNMQNDLQINSKQLAESALKTSKATLLSLRGQGQALAEAAFEAKKLGAELSQMEGIADSLLNIESSIAAEFEAEVILGKQLNLERARFFALTNNIAGLARELRAQDITAASFAKMTRIEQEAAAKAIGLSRDAMGEMLFEQEALTKLSGVEGADAKEKFNNLVKQVGLEKAKKKLGNDQLASQMASANIQERFAQSIQKLQTLFLAIAEPLMPIVDVFASVLGYVGGLLAKLSPLLKILTQIYLIAKAWNIVNFSILKSTKLLNGLNAIGLINDKQRNRLKAKYTIMQDKELVGNKVNNFYKKLSLGSSIKENLIQKAKLINQAKTNSLEKMSLATSIKIIAKDKIQLGLKKMKAFFENLSLTSMKAQLIATIANIGKATIELGIRMGIASAALLANSAATLGIGAAVAVAAALAGFALFKAATGDDVYSPPTAQGGYGDRMLLGPEGAIKLNNKDTVIAGTKLFKGDDIMSFPAGAVSMEPNIDYNKMALAIGNVVNDKQVTLSYTTFGQNTRPVFG